MLASIAEQFVPTRAVFVSDGEHPWRLDVRVACDRGRLTIVWVTHYGTRHAEQRLVFYKSRLRGISLRLLSSLVASFWEALPISVHSISLRRARGKRPRLSIDPPWPWDFTIYMYQSADFDVQSAGQLLTNNEIML